MRLHFFLLLLPAVISEEVLFSKPKKFDFWAIEPLDQLKFLSTLLFIQVNHYA